MYYGETPINLRVLLDEVRVGAQGKDVPYIEASFIYADVERWMPLEEVVLCIQDMEAQQAPPQEYQF